MTQDVVTAKEVAAPATVTLRLQDAQPICDKLNEALAKESYRRTTYSEPVRSVFQLAWAVASHKRSVQVTVYHLAYGLVCRHLEAGKELAASLGSDVESFAVGCILRLLTLGLSTGDKDVVPPSIDAVRWLGEGVALALKRGQRSELLPEDLVRAVQEDSIPHSVRAQLRAAARLGTARRDAILGPRSVPSVPAAPSSPSEIIKQMEEVEKGRAAAGPTDDLTNLVELLEDFEQRHTADVADQKQALASAGNRLVLIEQRVQAIDDVMNRLERIDRRLEELPRTPSGARLTVAIVAVLTLGVAVGLALRFPQPVGSLLAKVVSAVVK
jgi:hypothetical protein